MRVSVPSFVLVCGLAAWSCGVSSGSQSTSDGSWYSSTSLRLQPDGTVVAQTEWLTGAQMQQQLEARIAQTSPPPIAAIVQDPHCASSDIWLYDEAGLVGDRVCFSGAGTVRLELVPDCGRQDAGTDSACPNWSGAVRSYISGNRTGHFTDPDGTEQAFPAHHTSNFVLAIVKAASSLTQN